MSKEHYPQEITKAVAYTWITTLLYFFQASLTLAVDELTFGYKLQIGEERKWPDDFLKDQSAKGLQLPSITSLLHTEETNSKNSNLINSISGSFVKFLIQKYSIEKFKHYYISIPKDTTIDENETPRGKPTRYLTVIPDCQPEALAGGLIRNLDSAFAGMTTQASRNSFVRRILKKD